MTRQEIEALWMDPRNRRWGLFYCCKADPRVVVPKRPKWCGWTVNIAHASAIPITLFLIALIAVPVWVVTWMGAGTGTAVATIAAAIAVECALCAYLASRTR